ncbi:MAG: metalloregulator ArsR/SmtB family transcription factor [Actinomycetia bacterium]|nr:metalloregulator ArsR/SmtB family transcription factor [Actinomycetes bacterium]
MNQSVPDHEPAGFDPGSPHWDEEVYEQLARLGKALSNPLRIRLLDILEQGEHTVEELATSAGLPVKNTSAQLQQLRASQLVATRRDGVRVHYRLADPSVSTFVHQFESFAEERLSGLRVELDRLLTYPGALERVSAEDFQQRVSEGTALLIDVRSTEEYAKGHLPGAISIPLSDLNDRIDEVPDDADIVAYCEGPYCLASARAVRLLLESGHNATRIEGGLARWVRSGGDLTV